MALPKTPSGRIIGCVGPKGSGKTFRALHLAKSARRVIRYDLNKQADMEAGAVVLSGRSELAEFALAMDGRSKMAICWRGVERDPGAFEWANR
jgi:hypothetical protein